MAREIRVPQKKRPVPFLLGYNQSVMKALGYLLLSGTRCTSDIYFYLMKLAAPTRCISPRGSGLSRKQRGTLTFFSLHRLETNLFCG